MKEKVACLLASYYTKTREKLFYLDKLHDILEEIISEMKDHEAQFHDGLIAIGCSSDKMTLLSIAGGLSPEEMEKHWNGLLPEFKDQSDLYWIIIALKEVEKIAVERNKDKNDHDVVLARASLPWRNLPPYAITTTKD